MTDGQANQGGDTPSAAGGARSVDLTTEADRGLVRTLARAGSRWPITDETRAWVMADLKTASDAGNRLIAAGEQGDGAHILTSVAKTVATLDKLNQADEHLANKNERLDLGKATENIGGAIKVIDMAGGEVD